MLFSVVKMSARYAPTGTSTVAGPKGMPILSLNLSKFSGCANHGVKSDDSLGHTSRIDTSFIFPRVFFTQYPFAVFDPQKDGAGC